MPATGELSRIDFLVLLYIDASTLAQKMPKMIDVVMQNVPSTLSSEHQLLSNCVSEAEKSIRARLATLQTEWQGEIMSGTVGWAKHVADIPRLYRKTNRDAPTKACNYVDQILRPAQAFHAQYSSTLDVEVVQNCLRSVFCQLTSQ